MTEDEFDAFYAAAFPRLTGQLYAFTGDLGEAQDVVQEAFVRAWGRRHKLLVDEAPEIRVPGAVTRRVEGPRQWLAFPADASAAPIVAAVAAAYDVADLSIQEPDIEDVIRDLYSR